MNRKKDSRAKEDNLKKWKEGEYVDSMWQWNVAEVVMTMSSRCVWDSGERDNIIVCMIVHIIQFEKE